MIQTGNRSACQGLAQELNVVPLDILDHHDLHLVEEVDGEVGECIPQDGFLDEEDVAACLLDLLHDVEDVGPLFLEDTVHSGVVGYNNLQEIY